MIPPRCAGGFREPAALGVGEARERGRVGEDDRGLRPQVDVRRDVRRDVLLGVHAHDVQVLLEPADVTGDDARIEVFEQHVRRRRAESGDGGGLTGGRERLERHPLPVVGREQRSVGGDGLAQATSEQSETGDAQLVDRLEKVRCEVARDDGVLQRVAVDDHRRGQRRQRVDAEQVEHPGARPAEVSLTGRDIAHDRLLGVRSGASPFVRDLDRQLSAGDFGDGIDEGADGRFVVDAWNCGWPSAGRPDRCRPPCRGRPRRRSSPRGRVRASVS